jgi:hypothetical protein
MTRAALIVLLGCAKAAHPSHPVLLEGRPPDAGRVASGGPPDAGHGSDLASDQIPTAWLPNRPVTDLAHLDDLLCEENGILDLDARPDPDAAVVSMNPPKLCVKGACQDLPSEAIASPDGKLVSVYAGDRAMIAQFPSMKKVSDPRCPGCKGQDDDFGCNLGFFLGADVYLGIGQVCEENPAHPFLAHVATGKAIALVGGGASWDPVQGWFRFVHLMGDTWAISGNQDLPGGIVVVQDVKTGRVLRFLRSHNDPDDPDAGPKGGITVTDENGKERVLHPRPCSR